MINNKTINKMIINEFWLTLISISVVRAGLKQFKFVTVAMQSRNDQLKEKDDKVIEQDVVSGATYWSM